MVKKILPHSSAKGGSGCLFRFWSASTRLEQVLVLPNKVRTRLKEVSFKVPWPRLAVAPPTVS